MSFEAWYKRRAECSAVLRAMPWIKDELRDAWVAARKKPKPRKTSAKATHPERK